MLKTVSVNIVMTYPVYWTKYQVLRDFAQNFYDAIGFDDWRQCFNYEYKDGKLSMWVKDISFSYEWLMHIGASTKRNQSNKRLWKKGRRFLRVPNVRDKSF